MLDRRFSSERYIKTILLALILICGSFGVSAAQQSNLEYDLFSFSNISAQQGQKLLMEANIGDVSHLPDTPTVLFTSSAAGNMQRARLIKNLVDCREEYAVKVILCDLKSKPMPSCGQIKDNIGTIAIGSFTNPPAADGYARTIVDTCNNNIIIIAPLRLMDRIVKTIEKLQNSKPDIFGQTGTPVIINSNKTEVFSQSSGSEKEPILASAALTENISKKKSQNMYAFNERITDSTIVTSQSSSQAKPAPTQSNLLAANDAVNAPNVPNPEDEVVLNLSDQLTLIEFIGWVGPYLKMDFMYNAEDFVNKNVTINPNGVLKGRIKIKDLYNYLDTVLRFKGFIMTRGTGNLVIIAPKDSALTVDATIVQPGQAPVETGDSVRVDFFQLKHISTSTAEDLIKNMKLSIQINSIPETKTLIITEYTSRMPRIKTLLDIVDKPGEPKKFVYRQLQYTMAPTLAPKIQALAQQLGTVSITISAATAEAASVPERPTQRQGESDAAFQNRLRNWEAEVRRITEAATRPRTPSPATAAPAEPAASTVFLDSDDRTNRILMIGLEEKLKEVENLIDALDVVQQDPRKLQIYKINYLGAEEVMLKLQDLKIIPENQGSQGTSGTQRTTRTTTPNQPARITTEPSPIPVTAESGKSASESTIGIGEEPLVVLVASTNSLLVNATDEQQERIAAIIDLVDKARVEIPFRVYVLKNTNPEYIKDILDPLIEETVETVRNPEDKIQASVVSKVSKQDERITIVADANTSSLIVNANKKNQDWIETLIKELDKRKPQVLIDVTLVQISKTDAFDYDLNLLSSFPDLTNTSGLTSAIMPGISAGSSNLFNPPSGKDTRYADFQSNGGAGTAFYGDKHINTLLHMMEQKNYGRVMAKPKILVNDNQLGKIESKDVTYVTKTSSIPVTTGAAGEQTNLIQTAVDYAPYDAGVTLNITPHISESNLLRLDIQLIRKDFGTITGVKPPDTTDSTVETTVTVPDRSTIILGGLIKLNQSKGGTKIPLLGDIPIIGAAFRSTSNSDIQRNLYVFVKAEIIRPPDEENSAQVDLERISKENREAFEKFESEFQGYKSFPPVKPSPMDPAKALDAE